MMNRSCLRVLRYLLLPLLFTALEAHAEPYLAVQTGFKCGQCHVNPTGGGERTVFGNVFAQTQLAAKRLDAGGSDLWTGEVNRFLSIGGNVRGNFEYTKIPNSTYTDSFNLKQARVYAAVNVIPQRFFVYVDEQIAPGTALNREVYGVYWSANHQWYLKAGQMYLPFGLRLQDQTALINFPSGINMLLPDRGVELGFERGHWDAQLALTNGTTETTHGKQVSSQLAYVESMWRLGLAANFNSANTGGSKVVAGVFAGLRTGPIAWLGQVDLSDDHSLPVQSGRQLGTLLEANWRIAQGHNLKLTHESRDPNRSVANDGQTRYSIVYEMTPIQFVQVRTGFRYSDGIPQVPTQHLKLGFVELHGFF